MAKRITISDAFEAVEVDLLGTLYETRPITRSVQHQAVELEKASGSVLDDQNADPDKQVEYLARVVALRLVPSQPDGMDAGDFIISLYQSDKLRLDQLVELIDELGGSEANPTL